MIRDTILDNARECRSSSESAANGSQLISVYYSTGVRARGLESVRKYGRSGPVAAATKRREKVTVTHAEHAVHVQPSDDDRADSFLKVLGSSGRLVAR